MRADLSNFKAPSKPVQIKTPPAAAASKAKGPQTPSPLAGSPKTGGPIDTSKAGQDLWPDSAPQTKPLGPIPPEALERDSAPQSNITTTKSVTAVLKTPPTTTAFAPGPVTAIKMVHPPTSSAPGTQAVPAINIKMPPAAVQPNPMDGTMPAVQGLKAQTPIERHPIGAGDIHERIANLEVHMKEMWQQIKEFTQDV